MIVYDYIEVDDDPRYSQTWEMLTTDEAVAIEKSAESGFPYKTWEAKLIENPFPSQMENLGAGWFYCNGVGWVELTKEIL